jgi:hypothetical protein
MIMNSRLCLLRAWRDPAICLITQRFRWKNIFGGMAEPRKSPPGSRKSCRYNPPLTSVLTSGLAQGLHYVAANQATQNLWEEKDHGDNSEADKKG